MSYHRQDLPKLQQFAALKRSIAAEGKVVFDLSMINPDLEPPRLLTDKLLEFINRPGNQRYAVSRGVRKLREAFSAMYRRNFEVALDPDSEACVCFGSKEALLHLLMSNPERSNNILVGSLLVSFICSMTEAALYSVPVAYVRMLADSGSAAGKVLDKFKADMSVPITGILILNTTANTAGASFAGYEVAQMYNSTIVGVFSVIFTLLVLYCGELIPKIVGVNYCRPISVFMALPLNFVILLFTPLIKITGLLNRGLKNEDTPTISSEEIQSLTDIGTKEGSLDDLEGEIINNVIELDQTMVRDILTPRVVVFRIDESTKLSDLKADIANWSYTRVPLFNAEAPDVLTAYVNQRDVYREMLAGNWDCLIRGVARELKTVPELMRVDKLLLEMLADKEHICAVADEHGGLAGIVTLEDIIEEITGHEIVDEYDTIKDLRRYARLQGLRKSRSQS